MSELFTPAQIRDDAVNRVARTGIQGGVAGAVVTIGEWAAHQAGWHGSLPTAVAAAMVLLLTAAGSAMMNRSRLKGHA